MKSTKIGSHRAFTPAQVEDIVSAVENEDPRKRLLTTVSTAHRRHILGLWLPNQFAYFFSNAAILAAELTVSSVSRRSLWLWLSVGMGNWVLRSALYLIVFRAEPADVARSNWLRTIPVVISLISTAYWVWSVILFVTPEMTLTIVALHLGFLMVSIAVMGMWPTTPIAAALLALTPWLALLGRSWSMGLIDFPTALTFGLCVYVCLHIFVYSTVIQPKQHLDRSDVVESMRIRATEELQRRSLFFAGASHDFRQRLHAMKLMVLSTQVDTQIQDRSRRALERVCEEFDDLEDYTLRVFEFAKLEAVGHAPNIERVELGRVFQEAALHFEEIASASNVVLEFRHTHHVLMTDATMLQRMLENLVSNALKFTRKRVLVAARKRAGELVLEVWDQGPGVPPEMREAIFEAFHQDNRAATTGGVGVGLGLAVVTMFAARLRCKVTLLSKVGCGSVFRLCFPIEALER